MMTLFESADPTKEQNDSLLVRDVLDRGVEQLAELEEKPSTQLELMEVLSDAYWGLGLLDKANGLNESALAKSLDMNGSSHRQSVDLMERVGLLHASMGHQQKADSVYKAAQSNFLKVYGEEDARSIVFMYRMAFNKHALGERELADSLLLSLEPLVDQITNEDSEDASLMLTHLSDYYEIKGPPEKAMRFRRISIDMKNRLYGPDDYRVLEQRRGLTRLLLKEGQVDEAQSNAESNLKALRDRFPDGHYILAQGIEDLGLVYAKQDRFAAAEILFKEALSQSRVIYGDEHYHISHCLGNLGVLYERWGKYDQAIDYYGRGMELSRKLFPPHFPITLAREIRFAEILNKAKQKNRAVDVLRQSYALSLEKYGSEYQHTKVAKERLIEIYETQGKNELADELRL